MATQSTDIAPNVGAKPKKRKKKLPPMFQVRRLNAGEEGSYELIEKKTSSWEKASKKSEPGEGSRFKALVKDIKKGGKYSEETAKAIAAKVGRKKYGKDKFKAMAARGKKRKEKDLAASEELVRWVVEAIGGKKFIAALFANKVLGKRTSKPGRATQHKGAGKYAKRSYKVSKLGGGRYSVKRAS